MRTQNLTTGDNKHPQELYYLPIRWFEVDFYMLMKDEPSSPKRELEQLYQEAQEYDFLMGQSSRATPDYWDEEVE